MTAEAVVVLALLQGLTEFLPISSSAHLILAPTLLGWSDQGLAFDVAVHVGTLVAVILYFRRQLAALISDWIGSLRTRELVGESALAWGVLIGTVPVAVAGLTLGGMVETHLRSPLVIAAATLFFGLVLWLSDWSGRKERGEATLSLRDCIWIGIAQALALIPGTSRAGITITAGLAVGLTPAAAARFSFLLSIPTIFLAGGAKSYDLVGSYAVDWPAMALGAAISAASAYACIHAFLQLLDRVGMLPFILYRLALGFALLYVYW